MAVPRFKPRRSNTPASVPTTSNLLDGELAINSADKKIFLRDGNNILEIANANFSTGDKVDITISADGATYTIDSNVVTFAKFQQINTAKVLGRTTALTGNVEELSITGTGDVVFSTSPTLVTPVLGAATGTSLDLSGTASDTLRLSGIYTTAQTNPTNNSNTGFMSLGPTLTFNDTDKLATFVGNVNSYNQFILQNKNAGTSASSDFIVNNDRVGGTSIYGDFGINSSAFAGGGAFGDIDGTYLYGAGGTLSIGTLGANNFKIATNNTNRITITSAGDTTINGNTTLTLANSLTTSTGLSLDTGTTYDASAARTLTVSSNTRTRTINFIIDGGGSVITAGVKGDVVVDFNATIVSWDILGNVSGTITVDVSKASYTNFPTFTASAGTSPALSAAQKNQANINWTGFTTITAGDILRFTVSGTPVSVTRVTLAIQVITNA